MDSFQYIISRTIVPWTDRIKFNNCIS